MIVTLFLNVVVVYFYPAFAVSDDIYKTKTSDDYVPCESGWYYFRNKCYKIAPRKAANRFTWSKALALCRGYGGDLVSIHSQEEQDFIIAYLQLGGEYDWTLWIGLNDHKNEGDFKWSDGSAYNYSNFDRNEPSSLGQGGEKENCVQMVFKPWRDAVGKWNDKSCDVEKYAACKMNANPRKRSPNLIYCSPEEGGGWKYENSCFHIVTERQSWQNAERHCKNNYNGHLLTIRDTTEDLFLDLALPDMKDEVWIGIKINDQLQQSWTSGWFVSYESFSKEERFIEGTCVARKNRKEWITIPCSSSIPFICEVTKETPPVLKQPQPGSYCPKDLDDWRDFGGDYCYYIETSKDANFCEASFACQRRGGNLASLHSQEETDILHPFIIYKGFSTLIGLIRLKAHNGELFGWTDGSALDYQNWLQGEPNREREMCVEAVTTTMQWRDRSCDDKFSGYICSVKKIIPSSSYAVEESSCESFCISPSTYLHGIIKQCPEARRLSCKKN